MVFKKKKFKFFKFFGRYELFQLLTLSTTCGHSNIHTICEIINIT